MTIQNLHKHRSVSTKGVLTFIIHMYFLSKKAYVRLQSSVVFVIDRCDVNFAIVSDTANPNEGSDFFLVRRNHDVLFYTAS